MTNIKYFNIVDKSAHTGYKLHISNILRTKSMATRKLYLIILISASLTLGLIGLSTFVYENRNSLSAFAASLKPQPERFTELYFENHTNLPKNIIIGKANSFSFTIHNLEYEKTAYLYKVYAESEGIKQEFDSNSVTLNQDESRTITENFVILVPITRPKIVVLLTEKNQSIDFWIDKVSTGSANTK